MYYKSRFSHVNVLLEKHCDSEIVPLWMLGPLMSAVVIGIATTTLLALAPLRTFAASAFCGTCWNCLDSSLMRFLKNFLFNKYFNDIKSKFIHKLKYNLKQKCVFIAFNDVLENCSLINFNTMTDYLFSSRC